MSYISYHGAKCYPIFPCLNENDNMYKYDVDKMLEAMTILQNFEIPDNLIFYLQRETFGFQLILDALQNPNLINFDEYGDVVDSTSTPVNGKAFKRFKLENAVVIDSSSLAYTFPRIEYRYIPEHLEIEEILDEDMNGHAEDNKALLDYDSHRFEPEMYTYEYKRSYPSCSLWSLEFLDENVNARHRSNILDRHIGPKPMFKQKLDL